MELIPIDHLQPSDDCLGCTKPEDEINSIVSDHFEYVDHLLEEHRTARPQEITNRPCFSCSILKTSVGKLNLAAYQLSYGFIENIQHLPNIIEKVDLCAPDNFYKLVGCIRDSVNVHSDLIVAKLTPEDVEDEDNYEQFFQLLVHEKKFGFIGLPCEIFKAFYLLPLPKEDEPAVFMPIASRLNLEKAPREENHLLGLLVRKPPQEEGEISEREDTPVTEQRVDRPPESQLLSPISPESPPMSYKQSTRSESSSQRFGPLSCISVPKNRYDSFIGRSKETIPFLTDEADDVQNKAGPSNIERTKKVPATPFNDSLEQISSSENENEYSFQEFSNRKRSRSTSIDAKIKVSEPTQNKVRASSSSSFFNASRDEPKSSSTLTTTIEKVSTEKSKSVPFSKYDVKICEAKKEASSPEVIDVNDSSNSDPDSDFFPRKSNTGMSGTFYTNLGSFEFKYLIISSNISKRKNIMQYFPISLQPKGRANTSETENFLTGEMQRLDKKMITFQLLPNDTVDDKKFFRSYVVDLHNRSRYGLLDYKPDVYRAYVFPCIKGNALMKAFEICNLKPSFNQESQLYGIIVKKTIPNKNDGQTKARHRSTSSMTSVDMPSPTSSAPVKVSSSSSRNNVPQKKSFDIESPDYHEDTVDFKNYPGLESDKLIEVINSSIDDLFKLSANLTNMVHKAIDGQAIAAKIEAAEECRKKIKSIIAEDERQHAKRQQAYKMALDILSTIHKSLSYSKS